MQIIKPGTNFNFVGVRKYAYTVSLALIFMTIVVLLIRGGLNYGVDFAGGTVIQIKFHQPTTAEALRSALTELNLGDVNLQRFGRSEDQEFLIRVQMETAPAAGPTASPQPAKAQEEKMTELSNQIQGHLEGKFGKGSFDIRRVEMVGPKVGQDLRQKALFAIFYAILFIVIYISGRFEFKWLMSIAVVGVLMASVYLIQFLGAGVSYLIITAMLVTFVVCFIFKLKYALGAIIALVHDVTITVGIFSVLNKEMTLTIVAAILTIIGYSLNDTIIVFDRIRENLRKARKRTFAQTINDSVNETLSRTVLTSGLTLLAVISLFLFGGPVISDFALAMIIGIIVGTYSSIYVASPILLIWPPETGKPMGKMGARRR